MKRNKGNQQENEKLYRKLIRNEKRGRTICIVAVNV
jgi:hypothetical protein